MPLKNVRAIKPLKNKTKADVATTLPHAQQPKTTAAVTKKAVTTVVAEAIKKAVTKVVETTAVAIKVEAPALSKPY